MTHHYIPFANFPSDWQSVNSLYPDAAGCRITLRALQECVTTNLPTARLWVDAEVDGLHSPDIFDPTKTAYEKYRLYVEQFVNSRTLSDQSDKATASAFVSSVLDSVLKTVSKTKANLGYISVPQLPCIPGAERNKINRTLAKLTLEWRSKNQSQWPTGRPPRLILPVIFAKTRGQMDAKTDRNEKVRLAVDCFEASGADGTWVVDATLNDHTSLKNERLPGVIHFHEELNAKLPPDAITIAGPYWGLNLILWARGLVRFPGIGVGRAYQYKVPGSGPQAGNVRVALAPLKRLALWSGLTTWLPDTLKGLTKSDPAQTDFSTLLKNLKFLQEKERARGQVAQFYKDWLARLESVPAGGRSLALYQDFSAAYVLGRKLKRLPQEQEDTPDPALIAKQFMINCL
jgi:hypothetical protein